MAVVLLWAGMVHADVAPPLEQTTFYFQQNNQPVQGTVQFTVTCFEKGVENNPNKILQISQATRVCHAYGCNFDTSAMVPYEGNGEKYCNLQGVVNGKIFNISDVFGPHNQELHCNDPYDIDKYDPVTKKDTFYNKTTAYNDCSANVEKEYYSPNGQFICNQFSTVVPMSECQRPGNMIIGGKCYEPTQQTQTCRQEFDQKARSCDQYLQDVTASVSRDAKTNRPFDLVCNAKVDISLTNVMATSTNRNTTPTQPRGFLGGLIHLIRCFFGGLVGKSC